MNFSQPFTIDLALVGYGNLIDGGGPYAYSNSGGDTQTDYNNITYTDARPKPSWSDIQAGFAAYVYDYGQGPAYRSDCQQAYDFAKADHASDLTALSGKAASVHTHAVSDVSGLQAALDAKASLSGIGKAVEGTTIRSGAFPIFKTVTVSSGSGVMHLTADGLSTGTPLFPNGIIADSVNVIVSDSAAAYQMSWALSNSNKTVTVTANKLTTSNILTGILGQAQANSAVIKLSVWGY